MRPFARALFYNWGYRPAPEALLLSILGESVYWGMNKTPHLRGGRLSGDEKPGLIFGANWCPGGARSIQGGPLVICLHMGVALTGEARGGPFKGPRGHLKGPRGPLKGPKKGPKKVPKTRGPFKGPGILLKDPEVLLKDPRAAKVAFEVEVYNFAATIAVSKSCQNEKTDCEINRLFVSFMH